jgi:hypothetical protein
MVWAQKKEENYLHKDTKFLTNEPPNILISGLVSE